MVIDDGLDAHNSIQPGDDEQASSSLRTRNVTNCQHLFKSSSP
jgi:hypothetical protein